MEEVVNINDYEKRDRRTARFFQDEKEREDTPFLVKAGIGVAVAAGALTVAHRSGAMRKVAKFLDTEAKATVQAARETLDNQGSFFRGKDKLTMDRMKVLRDSFKERRTDILSDLNKNQANILSSREMQLAYELRQRERVIGSMEKQNGVVRTKGEVAFHIREGFRHAAVMEKFNQKLPDATEEVSKALSKGRLGILDFGSDKQLQLLLKEHGSSKVQTKDVFNVLKEARDAYKGKDFVAESEDAQRLVSGMQERLRQETADRMGSIVKKNGKIKETMIGHKQATVNDILELNKAGKLRIDKDLEIQIADAMKYNKKFGDNVFDKDLYLNTKDGELFDYNTFSRARRNTADWWSGTIPGGLMRLRDILNIKEAREKSSLYIFQRGTTLSALNGHMGIKPNEALNEEMVFMYGKFVKLNDADAINSNTALNVINDRDMYLTSSQFGTSAKMHRHMSGLMTDNNPDRNPIAKFLDVGDQDKDSTGLQILSTVTKFRNKDWERNRLHKYITKGMDDPEEYFLMNSYFKLNTESLSPRVMNNLKDHLSKDVRTYIEEKGVNFSREEDMLEMFKHFGKREADRMSRGQNSPHTDMAKLFQQFDRNPNKVLNRQTPVGESNPFIGHHTRMQTGMDEINQQTSLFMIQDMLLARANRSVSNNLLDEATPFRGELRNLYYDGRISEKEMQKSEEILNFAMFRSQGHQAYDSTDASMKRVSRLFKEDKDFQDSMKGMVRRTNPLWERFSSARPENQVGDEYLAISSSQIPQNFNKMFGIHSSTKERLEGLWDLTKQFNPFTGRKNMQDATTLNMFATYFPVYRLQDALGNMGLGFSDQSMANGASMMFNIMAKRIFPVYAGVEAAKYVDYETDKHTGQGISERWENYKASNRLQASLSRSEEDIYNLKRERALKPGIDHWEEMPGVYLPGIGPISMGDVLNNTLGRVFGDKVSLRDDDMMNYEETEDDIYNGEEAIRKSRYWFAGSKSAFRGERIIEYAPNSFRKAHSDHEYTNTSATGEEYWGNHLLPTLENPLGGLAFLFGTRDPYWYEKKHEHDRPYMLTGELFNPNTMLFGDIGNATIGKLIKPVKEMHPEYWGDPQLIYEDETQYIGDRPDSPVRTTISPAGRTEFDVIATTDDYGAPGSIGVQYTDDAAIENINTEVEGTQRGRFIQRDELDENGNPTGGYVAYNTDTEQTMYVPASIAKEGMTKAQLFDIASQEAPEDSQVKAMVSMTSAPSVQAQISTAPRGMFDEDYAYRQEIQNRKYQNIVDPRSKEWRTQEGIENWSEPLGAYKWILGDEVLGRDPYSGQMVIQRADAAYNASNRFWESELGSLGGAMSEIGRRFIRKDSGMLDDYNPIRNTMPDWMPGSDYFINFQIGDPYTKLPNGEYRLPGEAYESLNELHSDETGRYGAFDKFKILADVAPYSDEYNFWSQYLLETLPEGSDIRKEATEIRKQVAGRRTKYEFVPYKFKYNDIATQEVTVTKFLDDYTFLTEEMGDTPIRLAGMEYRKKAPGVLQNYFQEGDKVTIGVAADEEKRISKDTYGTMRAVIYNELGNINKDIIERGRMVENVNDFSAAGLYARYTPQEIKKGQRWESLAHFSSPLNTKFLQVRSAYEEYERDQIYGKDWATWDNFLLDDYIIPTMQGLGRFDNPLQSTAAGAVTGGMIGFFFLKGGKPRAISAAVGGLFGLGMNIHNKRYEKEHGEMWLPEHRRRENDINEYFDILKYLKFEGLYQKAREEIAHTTGYDVEDFATIIDSQKELTATRRDELEAEKKQLFLDQPEGWEDRRKEINHELNGIAENQQELYLPDNFLQALKYKEERDTTLYAIDPYDDRMKVMQAFPYKDKRFFSEFLEAPEEEREKILKIVPENQRRIYKALFGYGLDEQKPLEYYMEKYSIPDWDWEGWKPDYSLDDIKVKAVQEQGLDLSDFNFWDDDVTASQYVPDLQDDGGNAIEPPKPSGFKGFQALRQNLISVLQGQGLYDVQVTVQPSNGHETHVQLDYMEDRRKEVEKELRENMDRYM